MRHPPFLALLALFVAAPAGAQVSVDLHALEALPRTGPARPAARPGRPRVVVPPTATATTAVPAPSPAPAPPVSTAPVSVPPVTVPTPLPDLPTGAPPTANVPPPQPPAQTASAQPAPEPPKPVATNLRLAFAAEQTELSKDANAALEGLLHTAYATGAPAFTVVAYASGRPDDTSASRRTSLARAMATRNALMAQGVPSRRITVRALGNQAGDGPPDRVDITATPSNEP